MTFEPLHHPVVRAARTGLISATIGVLLIGCGGSGGSGTVTNPIVASFLPSGTPSTPDTVRLTGTAVGDIVEIDVVIAGQTTSDDLYSFAFDLALGDPTVVQYLNNSVSIGSALELGPGQQGEALAGQNGDRVTIGVTKLAGSGNDVGAVEEVIVSLTFRVLKRGMTTITITGSPPHDPAALDSSGAVIGSVQFDSLPAAISAS